MSKTYRFFKFTAWSMIAVGIFSIVTGFLSLIGLSEVIWDKVGTATLFSFINGGIYFMLCGAIHIADGYLGLCRLKGKVKGRLCIILGIVTLAWQLAAFIYILTLTIFSIRAALMVILPIIYLAANLITEFKQRLVAPGGSDEKQGSAKKVFVVKDIFGNFKFSFKRKSLDLPKFEGKRRSTNIAKLFSSKGKRRSKSISKLFSSKGKRRRAKKISMRKFK